jgi:cell division protein FtsL
MFNDLTTIEKIVIILMSMAIAAIIVFFDILFK